MNSVDVPWDELVEHGWIPVCTTTTSIAPGVTSLAIRETRTTSRMYFFCKQLYPPMKVLHIGTNALIGDDYNPRCPVNKDDALALVPYNFSTIAGIGNFLNLIDEYTYLLDHCLYWQDDHICSMPYLPLRIIGPSHGR